MKVMQVGPGSFGWKWMEVILDHEEWEYSTISTRDDTVRDESGDLCGLPDGARFTNLEEMLTKTGDADAVLVTTPYFLHAEQALESLRHGRSVLLRSPSVPL